MRGSRSSGFGRVDYVASCIVAFVAATIVVAPAKSQTLSISDVVRRDEAILAARRRTYEAARKRNPERWARNTRTWERVEVVKLNPEREKTAA